MQIHRLLTIKHTRAIPYRVCPANPGGGDGVEGGPRNPGSIVPFLGIIIYPDRQGRGSKTPNLMDLISRMTLICLSIRRFNFGVDFAYIVADVHEC